jgi:hypothetical protein
MLRSLVLILLIVNAALFAWSQGWLNKVVGVQPDAQHEPQRMARQIHADKIVVRPPKSASPSGRTAEGQAQGTSPDEANTSSTPVATPASAASTAGSTASSGPLAAVTAASAGKDSKCVEAGPFSAAEYAGAESAVRAVLPAGSWNSHTVAIQGLWLVYMGPYRDPDMFERKQVELRRIKGLNFEEVRTPANLAPGISLGRFTRIEDAEAGLAAMRNRGIRTARIVNLRPAAEVQVLKVPQASVGMQVALAGLKLPQGKGFSACRP